MIFSMMIEQALQRKEPNLALSGQKSTLKPGGVLIVGYLRMGIIINIHSGAETRIRMRCHDPT